MNSVKVIVGSTNQVKIRAAREAFSKYFTPFVVGTEAESGVPAQPVGEETFIGARNRAKAALNSGSYDFGVGIEGGILELYERRFGFAAICVISSDGLTSFASTGMFPLPNEALRLVDQGKELGDAMDVLTGMKDTKKGPGAVGLLTKGVVNRTALYRDGVVFALIPHINRKQSWYLG